MGRGRPKTVVGDQKCAKCHTIVPAGVKTCPINRDMIEFGALKCHMRRGETLEDVISRLTAPESGIRFCMACGSSLHTKVRRRKAEFKLDVRKAVSISKETASCKCKLRRIRTCTAEGTEAQDSAETSYSTDHDFHNHSTIDQDQIEIGRDIISADEFDRTDSVKVRETGGKVELLELMGALRPYLEKIAHDQWGSGSGSNSESSHTNVDEVTYVNSRIACLNGNVEAMREYRNHVNEISDGLFDAMFEGIRPLYAKLDTDATYQKAQIRTAFILEIMAHMINQKHSTFSTHMLHRLYLSGVRKIGIDGFGILSMQGQFDG